jgi:hypothetical protein
MPCEPRTNTSLTYVALLEAFDKQGCPICRLLTEHSLRYLDALVYEQVNDVGLRRKLRAARGLCNWHAWQAAKVAASAHGVAIIANDLITEEVMRLDDFLRGSTITPMQPPRSRWRVRTAVRAFLRSWQQKQMCPACQVVLEHERHALETMLNGLAAEEFAHRVEHTTPLCIPHTTRMVEIQGRHPQLHRLLALQRHKYARLVGELDEFCRKHDYRFIHEAWGTESDAWLRAIALLAGKPEVFGNDLRRRELRHRVSGGWENFREWWRR